MTSVGSTVLLMAAPVPFRGSRSGRTDGRREESDLLKQPELVLERRDLDHLVVLEAPDRDVPHLGRSVGGVHAAVAACVGSAPQEMRHHLVAGREYVHDLSGDVWESRNPFGDPSLGS